MYLSPTTLLSLHSTTDWENIILIQVIKYLLHKNLIQGKDLLSTDSKCLTSFLTFAKGFNLLDSELGKFLGLIFS